MDLKEIMEMLQGCAQILDGMAGEVPDKRLPVISSALTMCALSLEDIISDQQTV